MAQLNNEMFGTIEQIDSIKKLITSYGIRIKVQEKRTIVPHRLYYENQTLFGTRTALRNYEKRIENEMKLSDHDKFK